jgi:hypothetical protein
VTAKTYEVKLFCRECSTELNSSIPMHGDEIRRNWTSISMGSAFCAGRCPKGCRPTFSDLNINTRLAIFEQGSNREIEFKDLESEAQ